MLFRDEVSPQFTLALQVLQIANFVSSTLTVKNFHANDMFTCGCERERSWDVNVLAALMLTAACSRGIGSESERRETERPVTMQKIG